MIHHFDCDNCGKTVETYCFDESDNIVTYYSPHVDRKPTTLIHSEKELGEYLVAIATSSMTTLCKECINQ